VGVQISDSVMAHRSVGKEEARETAIRLLELVGIPNIERRMDQLPSMWSGGMLQRAAIARALAGNPDLLIADEPTTSLDVTIQAQILEELKKLKQKMGLSLILITHDMGVLAEVTQSLVVMYAGKVFEAGKTSEIFKSPKHPYTVALLKSTPRVDKRVTPEAIPGDLPSTITPPPGCRFSPRCPFKREICYKEIPEPRLVSGRWVSCHFAGELNFDEAS
jgi:oligopeptide/dipeptide ABC transporter ATP-binding protein